MKIDNWDAERLDSGTAWRVLCGWLKLVQKGLFSAHQASLLMDRQWGIVNDRNGKPRIVRIPRGD